MPKYVRGKMMSMTDKEYKSIKKVGDLYVLELVPDQQLDEKQVNAVFVDIGNAIGIKSIQEKYGITKGTLDGLCKKHYATTKITEVRNKIIAERAVAQSKLPVLTK